MGKKTECMGCVGFTEEHTCDGYAEYQDALKHLESCQNCIELQSRIEELEAEVERLEGRCKPNAIVMIDDTGHYVSEPIAAYITELEALASEVVESERLNRGTTRKSVDKRMPRHKRFEAAIDKLYEMIHKKRD
jgi:hypothetical protein